MADPLTITMLVITAVLQIVQLGLKAFEKIKKSKCVSCCTSVDLEMQNEGSK